MSCAPQLDARSLGTYTGRLADMIEALATTVEDSSLEQLPVRLERLAADVAALQSGARRGGLR